MANLGTGTHSAMNWVFDCSSQFWQQRNFYSCLNWDLLCTAANRLLRATSAVQQCIDVTYRSSTII